MGSLGSYEEVEGKKAMWLYPKIIGSNPSERWGHTSCFFKGHVYVFGGCCGGMHYSDVLVLNLETVSWTTLVTTGPGPGPRDSHTATLWGNKIIVFGGTNGSKKVNDLHILDLDSNEWTQPSCSGSYPSARESHTATLVGDGGQLAVFGGSGEGVGNYLNDLHFLDLKTMSWSSPMVKGDYSPPPRDSHVSVAVGRKVFVYGGDCGDRYHGDVDVFDVDSLLWSRLEVLGPSPGRRAGHAVIGIGNKVYVVGGVGDKKYYNDTWVLDTAISSWSKLEICGQPPQGRFSHTAIVTDSDIAIYGGCGEDERPLGELLILQLGEDHPNGRYNISMCKSFGNHRNQRRRRSPQSQKTMLLGSCIETEMKNPTNDPNITTHSKRTRTMNTNTFEKETEQEEHSLSLSQNSSPSQSDQEQTTVQNPTSSSITVPQSFSFPSIMNQLNKPPRQQQTQQNLPDVYILGEHRPNQSHTHFLPPHTVKTEVELLTAEGRHLNHSVTQSLIGAEVHGKVDGSFDSGYLMTANVNGRMFRGVLFPPCNVQQGPNILYKGPNRTQNNFGQVPFAQQCTNSSRGTSFVKSSLFKPVKSPDIGLNRDVVDGSSDSSSPIFRALPRKDKDLRDRSDLQGVVLTLGGPGSSH